MINLMSNALVDCGHEIVNLEQADLVIVVQKPYRRKLEGKKYVLLQTEPPIKQKCDGLMMDKIWSFNSEAPGEVYFPLGYHPCLERSEVNGGDYVTDIGFIGGWTRKRQDFQASVVNKFTQIIVHDYDEKVEKVKTSRINLNCHSYYETPQTYTEWDRLCFIIANRGFLLSEKFYCPLPVIQYESAAEYDELVNYFLSHEKEREDMAEELYFMYRTDFDMRDILTEKLKGLV
jgi:hypothetical protein